MRKKYRIDYSRRVKNIILISRMSSNVQMANGYMLQEISRG